MQYRPEIDGLRALAVVPVIFFHAGFSIFSGGFLGVDVFFVISGYLITTIILKDLKSDSFSFLTFYERRIRRILPALFLILFFSLPLAWIILLPSDLKDFSQSIVATNLFASNILFQLESGYFETDSELKPLLHTWSLAIEEQFYLFFPIILLLLYRFRIEKIFWVLGLVIALSLISAQIGTYYDRDANFFFLPSRIWELGLGSILAFNRTNKQSMELSQQKTERELGSFFGLAMIISSFFIFDRNIPSPSLFNLLPTIGTVLIIYYSDNETMVGRFLSHRIVVGVGLISYSAYLWHNPIFTFVKLAGIAEPGSWQLFVLSILSLILAYITWKYIERPFRDRQQISRKSVFVCCSAASLILVGIGIAGHLTNGFETYFIDNRLNNTEKQVYFTIREHSGTGGDMANDMGDDGHCNFWSPAVNEEFLRRFHYCSLEFGQGAVILGDSHAMNIFNALHRAEFRPFLASVSIGECRPSDLRSACHYDEFMEFAENNTDKIEFVIVHQTGYFLLQNAKNGTRDVSIFRNNDDYELELNHINSVINYGNDLANHVKTIWLGPFTEARVDYRKISKLASEGFYMNERSLKIFEYLDSELKRIVASQPHKFMYISFPDVLEINSEFLLVDGCLTFRDADHLSVCGEEIVGEALMEHLNQPNSFFRGLNNTDRN